MSTRKKTSARKGPTPIDTTEAPEQDPRELAQKKMQECAEELDAVLRKYGCRIVPYLSPPEAVGGDGSAAIIRASYGLAPIATPST